MAATPEHAARVLGLDDQATLEDVRDARRALAKKYHPDCSMDAERASRHMARINAAADLLISHLKGIGLTAKRPSYSDFSGQHKARARAQSKQTAAENPKATSSNREETRCTRERSKPTQADSSATLKVVREKQGLSSKDRELVRFAMDSYRSVLDQISNVHAGPKVDAMALAYPASA